MEAAYKAGVPLLMAAKMREPWEFDYFDVYVKPYLNNEIQYLGEVPHAGEAASSWPGPGPC